MNATSSSGIPGKARVVSGMRPTGQLHLGHLVGALGNWVPLFAFGPGAPRFAGVLDNTEIGRRLAELRGLEGLPPAS